VFLILPGRDSLTRQVRTVGGTSLATYFMKVMGEAPAFARDVSSWRKNGGSLASVLLGTSIPRAYRLFHCWTKEF
jgi:hypothetical protein